MPSGQVTLKFCLSGTLLLLTQVLKLINNSWTKWKSLTDMLTCNKPIWFACGPLSFEHFHVCDLACYLLAISWITCWVSSKILESSFQGLSSSHLKLAQNLICKTGKSIVFFIWVVEKKFQSSENVIYFPSKSSHPERFFDDFLITFFAIVLKVLLILHRSTPVSSCFYQKTWMFFPKLTQGFSC